MNPRAKRVPRLWCALQGLLPLDACLAAQRAELALPPDSESSGGRSCLPGSGEIPRPTGLTKPRNRVATDAGTGNVSRRVSLRNQS